MLITKELNYVRPTRSGEIYTFVDTTNGKLYYIKTKVIESKLKLNACYKMSLDSSWIKKYDQDGRTRKQFRIFIDETNKQEFNEKFEYIDRHEDQNFEQYKEWNKQGKAYGRNRALFTILHLMVVAPIIALSFVTSWFIIFAYLPIAVTFEICEFKMQKNRKKQRDEIKSDEKE